MSQKSKEDSHFFFAVHRDTIAYMRIEFEGNLAIIFLGEAVVFVCSAELAERAAERLEMEYK